MLLQHRQNLAIGTAFAGRIGQLSQLASTLPDAEHAAEPLIIAFFGYFSYFRHRIIRFRK